MSFHATTFEVVPEQGSQRLKRAAIFAFATTVASVGCTNPQRPDTGNNIVQPYGAPPNPRPVPLPAPDAGAREETPQPIPIVPPYGAPPDPTPPPPQTDAGTRNEPPAVAAIYGAPPPAAPDAGTPPRRQGGRSPAPRYGAPPPPDDLH